MCGGQAAADLEYLCNVYAALGEAVPAPLNTYLHCVAAPRTAFAAAVQEATLVLLNPKLSCFGIKTGSGNI